MSIHVNHSVARSFGRTTSVTVHDGAHSYDNGGRLSQVIDGDINLTEKYTWNADNHAWQQLHSRVWLQRGGEVALYI